MGAFEKSYGGMTGSYWLTLAAVAVVGVASQVAKSGSLSGVVGASDYADNDKDFERWLSELDRELVGTVGVSFMDLPDRDWWAAYDAGMSPSDAIEYQYGVGTQDPEALIQALTWG